MGNFLLVVTTEEREEASAWESLRETHQELRRLFAGDLIRETDEVSIFFQYPQSPRYRLVSHAMDILR